jgi:hypothetical protein
MNRITKKNPSTGLSPKNTRRAKNKSKLTHSSTKAHRSDVFDAAVYQKEASASISCQKTSKNFNSTLFNSLELLNKKSHEDITGLSIF